jgi:hypothetical protein
LFCFWSEFVPAGSSLQSELATTLSEKDFLKLAPCFKDFYAPSCIIGISVRSAAEALSLGLNFAGYGSICEGCSLVIMLISFVAAGVLCIRRFYSGTTNSSTEAGRRVIKVRRQIIVIVSSVFLTFLIRALYAAALAASRQGSNLYLTKFAAGGRDFKTTCNKPNVIVVCDPCQGLGVLLQIWLWISPAFPFTVFLLSSPVTILIVLWSMTTDTPLPSLGWKWSGFQKKVALGDSMKSFIKAGGES